MFNKSFLINTLFMIGLSQSGVGGEKSLPLSNPVAPFSSKTKITASSAAKPEIKGNLIKIGNKDLQVSPDGDIKLFSDGRLVARSFLWFNTKRAWFPESSLLIKDKQASFNDETKTFFYSGKAPLNKSMDRYGSFSRSITLLPDGNVKFHYTWDTTSEDDDLKAFGVGVYLSDSNRGTQVDVDGKKYKAQKKRIFYKTQPGKLDLISNNPNLGFSIIPESTCYVTGTYDKGNEQEKVRIKLDPGTKTKELTFIMTLGNISDSGASRHKYAGIDFYALDKMKMPDYKSSKNIFQNSSFEQGFRYLWASFLYLGSYPHKEKWDKPFQIDNQVSKFGTQSLKIKTWDSNKPRVNSNLSSGYITSAPMPLEPGKYTLSFYAKGDRPGKQILSVFMPQVHWQKSAQLALPGSEEMKMGLSVKEDWTRYSCTVTVDKSMPGRVAFGACSESKDGHVWIDGVQLEKGELLTEYKAPAVEGALTTSNEGNFLSTDQTIDAGLAIFAKPDAKGNADVKVKNFFGETLFEQNFTFCCNGLGKAHVQLPFNDKFDPGIYVVKVNYKLEDGRSKFDFYRFSIMDKLTGNERLRKMFGANYGRQGHSHIFRDILKRNTQVGLRANTHCEYRLPHIFDEYKKHGITITDSWMAKKAPINGKDRGSFKIKEGYFYGKKLIGGFLEDNPTGELTEGYFAKFREAVKKCAEANPQIRRWSLFGEAFCWFPEMCALDSPDEIYNKYIKLQLEFFKAIKEFDPTLEVTNGDPPNMSQTSGIKLLERQLAATQGKIKYDRIAIHTYRKNPDNGDLDEDTAALLKMLKRYGYEDTPVFWPEGMHYGPYTIPQWNAKSASWTMSSGSWYYGTLSYDMGWAEKISAAWRARTWLVALKYQDRIKTAVSAHSFNNFIMDYKLTPFATQKISHTLTRLLGDAVFKKDVRFAPNTRCYIFEDKEKRPVVAVWGNHPKLDNGKLGSFTAEVSLQGNKLEIFDLMEQRRDSGDKDKVTFPITSFPLFFRGNAGDTDKFIAAFLNASLISGGGAISPLAMSGLPIDKDTMELTVKNQLSRAFTGQVVTGDLDKEIELQPLSSINISSKLVQPLRKDAILKKEVKVSITQKDNAKEFNTNLAFRGFLCGKANTPIEIDGNLDDWSSVSKIALPNRYKRKSKRSVEISDTDLSGWFKTAWDETGIYICVKVKDDKFFSKIDPSKFAGERWNNDSLQIFFDSLCDGLSKKMACYDDNDYDYAIFPNGDGKGAASFLYASPDPQLTLGPGAPRNRSLAPHIPSSFRLTDDGYIYEAKFPTTYLRPAVMKKGSRLGFGLFVNDRDDDSGVQSSLTNTPDGTQCHGRPLLWPIMLLTD